MRGAGMQRYAAADTFKVYNVVNEDRGEEKERGALAAVEARTEALKALEEHARLAENVAQWTSVAMKIRANGQHSIISRGAQLQCLQYFLSNQKTKQKDHDRCDFKMAHSGVLSIIRMGTAERKQRALRHCNCHHWTRLTPTSQQRYLSQSCTSPMKFSKRLAQPRADLNGIDRNLRQKRPSDVSCVWF